MKKGKSHLTKRHSRSKIESMAEEVTSMVTNPNRPKIIIIILGLLLIAVGMIVLNYYHIINLPFLQRTALPSNIVVNPHALDTCDLTKEGNALVDEFSIQAGIIRGSFKGNISELTRDEVRQSIILKLKSLDLTQEYKFNVIESPTLIINTLTNKIASSSALKVNQLIRLEFVCNNETKLLEYTKL